MVYRMQCNSVYASHYSWITVRIRWLNVHIGFYSDDNYNENMSQVLDMSKVVI